MLSGTPTTSPKIISVMGDSITFGYNLTSPTLQNWEADLISLLSVSYTYGPLYIGELGATLQTSPAAGPSFTNDNANGINQAIAASDIIIIMLGTNDAKTANKSGTTANYVANYKTLLDKIRNTSTRQPIIYIVTPPPATTNGYTIDPTFLNTTVVSLVQSLNGYAGARVIDVNTALYNTFTGSPSTYLTDGVHPTPAGDQLIANVIATAMQTYTGTVTASNGTLPNATQNFSIQVKPQPAIVSSLPPGATQNVAYRFSYVATASPASTFTVTSGALPTGLTLSSAGLLSGTPTIAGTFSGTVTATNANGSGSQAFSIPVQAYARTHTILLNLGGGNQIGGGASGGGMGGVSLWGKDSPTGNWWNNIPPAAVMSGRALVDANETLTPITMGVTTGLTFSSAANNGTTKSVTSPTGTVYSAAAAGEFDWVSNPPQFTISGLDSSGATRYTFTFFTSCTFSGIQNFFAFSGATTYSYVAGTTPTINSSANYNNSTNPTFEQYSFVPTSGNSTVTVAMSSPVGGYYIAGTLEITSQSLIPAITNGPAPAATVGSPYTFIYTADGTPTPTFTVLSGTLPPGLTLSSTGTISGTPTQPGIYSGTVQARNGINPNATQNFNIAVSESYTAWANYYAQLSGNTLNFSDSTAIPLHDQTPNLLKFLCDINPTVAMSTSDLAFLPTAGTTTSQGTQYLTLIYRQSSSATGFVLNLQTSSDLVNWQTVTSDPAVTKTLRIDSSTGDPVIQLGTPMTGMQRLFIRLKVTLP